jgi:hypothetical protein
VSLLNTKQCQGVVQSGLEYRTWNAGVASSNLATLTIFEISIMNEDTTCYYVIKRHEDQSVADCFAVGNFESDEAALEWVNFRYNISQDTRLVKLVAAPSVTLELVSKPK